MGTTNLNRRTILAAAAGMSATVATGRLQVLAQEATPEHTEHAPELASSRKAPDLMIEVTDDGITLPAEMESGLNHVTVMNSSSGPFSLLVATMPESVTLEEVNAILADPEAPAPEWLSQQWLPGTPNASMPGESATGYAFFYPGTYFAANIFSPNPAVEFAVAGDPWGVPAPTGDVRVGMVEYGFVGIEGQVDAGSYLVEVVNNGASLHELVVLSIPEMWSPEELLATMESGSEEDSAAIVGVGGTAIASPGATSWVDLELEVGYYAALCFASDDFAGPPHFLLGMISTFEVV